MISSWLKRISPIAVLIGIAGPGAWAQGKPAPQEPCKIVVLGFIGGTEFPNHKSSGIVQIDKRIRDLGDAQVCSKTYVPYSWMRGDQWIMKHFPRHKGRLSQKEIENGPKVIIFGHSLGGWATLAVARKLGRRGIPVELTVQVASVGFTDFTVPQNVKTATNFYTNDIVGDLIGTKRIRVRNTDTTRFLGNNNLPGTNHLSSTRNARISELIMETIRSFREPSPLTGVEEIFYPY